MPNFVIQRLPDHAAAPPDIPGQRVTIHLKKIGPNVATLPALLSYCRSNHDIIEARILRVLELYYGFPLDPKDL